jgi:hypothetical protein
MYRQMQGRRSNDNAPDVRIVKEHAVLAAFMWYLVSSGSFASWREEQAEWKILMASHCTHSIVVWTAFESQAEVVELASFIKLILTIVVNQAGCECTFSNLKIKQTQ